MKVLKALLAVLTTFAVVLTAALLLWQDQTAPRYIQIYTDEKGSRPLFCIRSPPACGANDPTGWGRCVFCGLLYRKASNKKVLLRSVLLHRPDSGSLSVLLLTQTIRSFLRPSGSGSLLFTP